MSKSGYDWYLENKKKYVENQKDIIDKVNKSDIPQHILWAKTVCKQLEDENDNAVFKKLDDDSYYFTERLVNKLMHFAYLQGSKSISEDSYHSGWRDCWKHVLNKLEISENED